MSEIGTLFGHRLDEIVRERGGWKVDAVAHTVEVLGKGEDPQILVQGEIPSGFRKDGSPQFPRKKAKVFKAVILLSEYRAAIAKAVKP
jgi:hypothetical protein